MSSAKHSLRDNAYIRQTTMRLFGLRRLQGRQLCGFPMAEWSRRPMSSETFPHPHQLLCYILARCMYGWFSALHEPPKWHRDNSTGKGHLSSINARDSQDMRIISWEKIYFVQTVARLGSKDTLENYGLNYEPAYPKSLHMREMVFITKHRI